MKKHYQNFIFDLYGTLAEIHTDEEDPELWEFTAAYLSEKGIDYAAETLKARYEHLIRVLERKKEQELRIAGTAGPAEIDITNVWELLAAEKGVRLNRNELEKLSDSFRTRSIRLLRLFPGAEEVLRALRNAGKKTVLLSNAQESFTMPELQRLGLDDSFDRIFISSREGVKKPSPAFFAKPIMAGMAPEQSLMIGNDDICDCHGAAAAGIDSLYIFTEGQSPKRMLPLPENCREIRSLTEILDYL